MSVEDIRKALWVPQARKFIRERFGQECVGQTFADVHQTPTIRLLRQQIHPKQLNIVQGTTGCGKTLGARLRAFHSICSNGKIGEYVRATDLSLEFGRGGYLSQDKEQRIEELGGVPWVIVDDLGAEATSERFKEIFFHLVDIWAGRDITAIFITNENPREVWPGKYGHRAWSRIVKWSRGEILRTADPDFRIHPEELKKYPVPKNHD